MEEEGEGELPPPPPAVETELDYISPQYQTPFLRNLLTLRLWSMFWTLFCLTGAEFVTINYSSYILGAINGKPTEQSMRTMLNVINGAGSAVGRLGMALFEYITQHRPPEKRIPMTWAPMFPTTLCLISLILLMTVPASVGPLAYVLLALSNGAQAAQTVLVPRVIYAKDPAKHYNFCFCACVLSSILLVRVLYAEWYNRKAIETGGIKGYCFGRVCVMMPLGVLLGLVCTTILSNLYLHVKYTRFCSKMLAERRQVRQKTEADLVFVAEVKKTF
ncbi:hypothetical protein ADEAN_001026100 [Angomonas deanei]|uniref:Nodulin-like n=1 Tax=Angomonas deanei TaxID=59799 RepID=A0A7G2CUT5_9TRYP|nr:hypothetical protein ADEAN_001026100 [Angomonas deanei]